MNFKYSLIMNSGIFLLQERLQDLEDTVLSLRRVLTEREREVGEFQAKIRSLESDLTRERTTRNEHQTPAGVPRLESREEVCTLFYMMFTYAMTS